MEQKIVRCFGDSITQGLGASAGDATYPAQLGRMLGDGYTVLNGGDGGEGSAAILTRQGAVTAVFKRDVIFEAGESRATLGTAEDTGIALLDGSNVKFTAQMGHQMSLNPVVAAGKPYTLELTDFCWNTATTPIAYTCTLIRETADSPQSIPAGTPLVPACAVNADRAYATVMLMGANDGGMAVETLIGRYRTMVDNCRSGRYLCVIPYWGDPTIFTAAFTAAFGDHAVDFHRAAVTDGLSREGLTPSATDAERLAKGQIPGVLCMGDQPNVHLNDHGYHLLATLIYEQGVRLGYWV